jgi:hypothetical protein
VCGLGTMRGMQLAAERMGLSSLLRLGARTSGMAEGVGMHFNPTELYERLVFRLWQCLLSLLRFFYRAICGAQGMAPACLPVTDRSLSGRDAHWRSRTMTCPPPPCPACAVPCSTSRRTCWSEPISNLSRWATLVQTASASRR